MLLPTSTADNAATTPSRRPAAPAPRSASRLNDANAAKSAIVGIIAQNVPPPRALQRQGRQLQRPHRRRRLERCSQCTPGNTSRHLRRVLLQPERPERRRQQAGRRSPPLRRRDLQLQGRQLQRPDRRGVLPLNACGGPCGCAVPPEICNGLDDNCDGAIDNGNYPTGPVGTKCNNGLKGACNRDGLWSATPAARDTVCSAPVITPQAGGLQRHRRQLRRADRRGDAARAWAKSAATAWAPARRAPSSARTASWSATSPACRSPRFATASTTTVTASSTTEPSRDGHAVSVPRPEPEPGRRRDLPRGHAEVHGRDGVRLRGCVLPTQRRGLQRQGQQLRRQGRHDRQLSRAATAARTARARCSARAVSSPARSATSASTTTASRSAARTCHRAPTDSTATRAPARASTTAAASPAGPPRSA